MNILLVEDANVENLYPMTTGRPAYAVLCAGYRLIDWLSLLELPIGAAVRPQLVSLQRVDFPELAVRPQGPGEATLLVNARVVPSYTNYRTLKHLVDTNAAGVVLSSEGLIAAAVVPVGQSLSSEQLALRDLVGLQKEPPLSDLPVLEHSLSLFEYPHDLIRYNLAYFDENLGHRIETGQYEQQADGIFVSAGTKLGECVITDTTDGPIVFERNASVGPHCYLRGPAHLGHGARVSEHSAIKDGVSLGHTTKIGGEVEASVIEPFTNKQHHGFLGHSYLGSWINLGAGTCNSDLKNTYGKVKMTYRGRKVDTDMQFVGCIMGDYSKTAINTGIFTGKTIGACSMVYGFVSTNVPSFVNYARTFGQITELSPEVMIATQKRMFVRRNVTQRASDCQLILDMYEMTRYERQLADEPLSL
jgi:UDP-N-acetylglucosamine diphosphorylase/glucosamine-1-phosphate N-acetyltransferase